MRQSTGGVEMGTLTSSLIVRLVDQVSRPARSVAASIRGINHAGENANRVPFGERLTQGINRNNAAIRNARGGLVDAAAGFYALRASIAAPVQSAMAFESVMADVKKVVNDFADDASGGPEAFASFQKGLKELSTQVPLSVRELGEIAAAAGEAGFASDQLLNMTETAAKIAVAFGSSAAETGKMLAVMQKSYGMSFDEAVLLSDAMNHLSNNMASNAPDLMNFWTRIAADAKQAGFSQEQAVAMGSAMIASGHGADVAATSFRNMAKALGRGESATKRQRNAYAKLGFDAKTISEEMQTDAVGTTRKVLAATAELPAAMRKSVSSDLFGDEARALGSIATNLDFFDKAMASIADQTDYAGSAFKEFETRAATFGNAAQIFKNRIETLKIAIGAALIPVINDLIERITPVIAKITDFANAHPELVSNIMAAVAAVVAFKVATAGLTFVGLLGKGGALSALSVGFKGIGLAARGVGAPFKFAKGALASFATKIIGTTQIVMLRNRMMVSAFKSGSIGIGGALKRMAATSTRALLSLLNPIGMVRLAFTALKVAMISTGIGALVVGLAVAGTWVYNNWSGIKAMFTGIGYGIKLAFKPAAPLIDKISSAFSTLSDWFSSLTGTIDMTEEQWLALGISIGESIGNAINSMTEKFNSFVDWITGIPRRIMDAIGSIDLSSVIKWPEPPDWWKSLFGGDEPEPNVVPELTAMQYDGFGDLSREHKVAAGSLENAGYSGGLPTPDRLEGLLSNAEALREKISGIQSELSAMVQSPMQADIAARMETQLNALQAELDATESELALAEQEAVDLTTALATLSETEATPEISTESIDEALQKVRRLAAELGGLRGGITNVDGPVGIDGTRAGGGDVRAGGTYLVGEEGPELVTFGQRGFVHTARQTMRAMRGAVSRFGSGSEDELSGAIPDLGVLVQQGAQAVAPTAQSAFAGKGSSSEGVTLKIDGPLTGPITIASNQNPLDVVEEIGEALELKLSRMLRGLHSDGMA